MKRNFIIVLNLLLIQSLTGHCQEKIEDFNGIWSHQEDEKAVMIINRTEVLHLYFFSDGSLLYRSKEIFFVKPEFIDAKNIDYKEAFTQDWDIASGYLGLFEKGDIDEIMELEPLDWIDFKNGLSFLNDFEKGCYMTLDNVNSHTYSGCTRLSREQLNTLYKKSKAIKRNLIKEYLELDVRNICVEKSFIYDSLEVKTQEYLIKDDLITVTGESGAFLEMEYETDQKKIITGLVRKEDVLGIEPKK